MNIGIEQMADGGSGGGGGGNADSVSEVYTPRKQLYVGCSLTHAPEDFKADVEAAKAALREDNWEVMEFLGLTAGTAEDVYRQDILTNVAECDGFVGIVDEPSIGLGWELGAAVMHYRKPSLAVAHVDSRITRLLLGAPGHNPNMRFRTYEDMATDVPAIVAEEFAFLKGALEQARQ